MTEPHAHASEPVADGGDQGLERRLVDAVAAAICAADEDDPERDAHGTDEVSTIAVNAVLDSLALAALVIVPKPEGWVDGRLLRMAVEALG